MQARAAEDLKRLVCDELAASELSYETATACVTPRRLSIVCNGIPARQPDRSVEFKGPNVKSPARAIEGFLRSRGLSSADQTTVRHTEKGSYYFYTEPVTGMPSR